MFKAEKYTNDELSEIIKACTNELQNRKHLFDTVVYVTPGDFINSKKFPKGTIPPITRKSPDKFLLNILNSFEKYLEEKSMLLSGNVKERKIELEVFCDSFIQSLKYLIIDTIEEEMKKCNSKT